MEKDSYDQTIEFELDNLNWMIRMASGEYKSLNVEVESEPKQTSLRLDLFEDSTFVIRYIPCKPPKADLEMLADNLYCRITNRLGCEVGKYSDVCSSWIFLRIIAMFTGKDENLIDRKTQIVITSYEMSTHMNCTTH